MLKYMLVQPHFLYTGTYTNNTIDANKNDTSALKLEPLELYQISYTKVVTEIMGKFLLRMHRMGKSSKRY